MKWFEVLYFHDSMTTYTILHNKIFINNVGETRQKQSFSRSGHLTQLGPTKYNRLHRKLSINYIKETEKSLQETEVRRVNRRKEEKDKEKNYETECTDLLGSNI